MFQFQEGKCPNTVGEYRTAIGGALKGSLGKDLGQDTQLSALLLSFHRERPAKTNRAPLWDLSLILWTLTQPPLSRSPMSQPT